VTAIKSWRATSPGSSIDLVHRLRDDVIPAALEGPAASAHVRGQAALFVDLSDRNHGPAAVVIGAVIGLSVVLLTMVFRSTVVPVKAAVMNLLSRPRPTASLSRSSSGAGSRTCSASTRPCHSWHSCQAMLFAILFVRSMDYEVFLLSLVRER
jgi:putative drug exporter of the RND superfamily